MRIKLAKRIEGLEPSGIRKVFDRAQGAKNPIDLIMGEPDFDVPEEIKIAGIEAIRKGFNKYTPTAGILPLREALSKRLQAQGIIFDEVMVTAGVSGAILLSCLSLIDPGDEVVIPDPYFVMYRYVVALCGGVPVFIDTYPDFHLHRERLEQLLTDRTKIIILNSPNNPTGAVYSEEEIKMVGDIAKSKGLIVISDEIYEHFLYDGRRHYSIGSIYPGTLTLKGFAKSYGMTGWRLGYVCGPGEIIRNMTVLQQYSFTCAPSVAQYAALTALESDVSPQIRDYQEKRDLIHNGLKDKYKVNKPEGAFYIFPEAPGKSAVEFINLCLEKELYVIPGDAFSGRDTHFRLSFAASREKLIRGIEVLNKLI